MVRVMSIREQERQKKVKGLENKKKIEERLV